PLLTLGVLVLIAAVASGPLARRISLPIERLTDAVRRFGGGDLSARVGWHKLQARGSGDHRPPRGFPHHHHHHRRMPDEIEQLTPQFDEIAERLERLVRGQKELLPNVSHELRSPLARMRVALELLPRDPAAQARVRDIELDLEELDRLIEDVLTTSRLEAS